MSVIKPQQTNEEQVEQNPSIKQRKYRPFNPIKFFKQNQIPYKLPNQSQQQTISIQKEQSKLNEGGIRSADENLTYYQEFCRLFLANQVLTNQMKELVYEKSELTLKLIRLEKKSEDVSDDELNDDELEDEKKKRIRRSAKLIDRHYICPHEECKKSYGTEGSLNQHLKLKHPK